MLFNILQSSVAGAAAMAENGVQTQEMSYSLLDMAAKGGPLMLVLLALSILAIYIFGKKFWLIRQAGKIDKDFILDIRDYINEGKTKSALTLCSKYDAPVARMAEAGINHIGKPMNDVQAAIENVGNVEVARLEKGLPYLATIAGGAPMIGFLGTVIGMVQAFFDMANAGSSVDIAVLSGGIYTAMITTVGGLIVGILAYFGYNYLTARITSLVYNMERATISFMDALENPETANED